MNVDYGIVISNILIRYKSFLPTKQFLLWLCPSTEGFKPPFFISLLTHFVPFVWTKSSHHFSLSSLRSFSLLRLPFCDSVRPFIVFQSCYVSCLFPLFGECKFNNIATSGMHLYHQDKIIIIKMLMFTLWPLKTKFFSYFTLKLPIIDSILIYPFSKAKMP